MNEIKFEVDRGDGLLLFDDFVDVMHRFVDVRAEHDILEKLEDKGAILWGELQALSHRSAKLPLVVLGLFFLSVVNMVFDVYLMAQSLYVRHYRLKRRIATYLGTFTAFFEHISFSSFVSVLKMEFRMGLQKILLMICEIVNSKQKKKWKNFTLSLTH